MMEMIHVHILKEPCLPFIYIITESDSTSGNSAFFLPNGERLPVLDRLLSPKTIQDRLTTISKRQNYGRHIAFKNAHLIQ